MKVLVVGKGGREHALVWKLAQSPHAERVFCAPGNAGTAADGVNVPVEANDLDRLLRFARKENIGLTVVGPEEPLALGIVDAFQKAGLRVFGPTREAARMESSKAFAKQLMRHADVPTADFQIFDHPDMARTHVTSRDYVVLDDRTYRAPFPPERVVVEKGKRFLLVTKPRPTPANPQATTVVRVPLGPPQPSVVKADGLAAGKGVFVCDSTEEALAAIERIMVREEFGRAAGRQVIIEKRLDGEELSVLALVAGRTIVTLPPCQDHKRAGDGDTGPNTGGMGAYAPLPWAPPDLAERTVAEVIGPAIAELGRRGTPYRGLLYAGLALTTDGIRVIEFNARFGDPETQVVLDRLATPLAGLLAAAADGDLAGADLPRWAEGAAVTVVIAAEGYPGTPATGDPIEGIDEAQRTPGAYLLHAGTVVRHGTLMSSGGRVLDVVGTGQDVAQARAAAYTAAALVSLRGGWYRTDIASHCGSTTSRPR